MKLTQKEESFLQSNHVILEGILNKRIEELKEQAISPKETDRERIVNSIMEYRNFMKHLKVEKQEIKQDDGI